MKAREFLLTVLACVIALLARAQVPQGTQINGHFSFVSFRESPEGKKLDFAVTGSSVSNLTARTLLVNDFEMKSFKNGDPRQVQVIADAPQCQMDVSNNVASDSGPLQIVTPTTNLFIQGIGFLFTQSNHFLILSNKVETRVVKSMLRSSLLSSPRPGAPLEKGQKVHIYADRGEFSLDANIVNYSGHVHVIDPQLDETSDFLTIRFDTNGALQSILARQNVVLTTTNNGRATGQTGLYYITNGDEMLRLTTDAEWHNGDDEAKAEEFNYNSTRHFLTGAGHVRVRWPATSAPGAQPATHVPATNGYYKLWADSASLQFPPTNGPVERMSAHGNVVIVNQQDQSGSVSDQADYERATGLVELTGHPVWRNAEMEVRGETLSAELNDKVYHARSHSHFKMRYGNVKQTGGASPTNQWLYISSDDISYRTNLAIFSKNVQARVEENGRMRDTLNCDVLTLVLVGNELESAFASGTVQGETAPDAAGIIKTIACEQLNAYRSVKTHLMKSIDAHTNVLIQEYGLAPGAPHDRLMADTVTAQYSPVTNQIERADAINNVVFDQVKNGQTNHATSERAVYLAANDEVRLTGSPVAHSGTVLITNADFLAWKLKADRLNAVGFYKILPFKAVAMKQSQ